MIRLLVDDKYKYKALFDTQTGFTMRSDVLDETGKETGRNPFMGSYPLVLDVGIMGHCDHGLSGRCLQSGVSCYQSGSTHQEPHMSFDNFKKLIDESKSSTFQIALGGRGDPNQHPDFLKIIRYCHENNVVPNFTTSGYEFDVKQLAEIKKYCGAVAVSWYRKDYTLKAISMLLSHGIKTNIHYVLSESTLDEAMDMIKNKSYPSGVNRIIFLLHKPVGLGKTDEILNVNSKKVVQFFNMFNEQEYCNIVGFDACSAPALIQYADKILPESFDTCEAGRFSAYVSPDMKLYPCSFDQNKTYAVDVKEGTVSEAWQSQRFEQFRSTLSNQCKTCQTREQCLGGCPLMRNIVLCDQPSFKEENRRESL